MPKAISYDRPKSTTINSTPIATTIHLAEQPGVVVGVMAYKIIAVDTVGEKFTVPGDHTTEFTSGKQLFVSGSTGNDGTYTVASSTLTGTDTIITVNENITDATVDGIINTGNTAILEIHFRADADESSGTDIQLLAKVTITPTIVQADGKVQFKVDFTAVNGDGSSASVQTKTFDHSETMDVWQTAAGRARQS